MTKHDEGRGPGSMTVRRLEDQIKGVQDDITEIKGILRSNYVTQDQFAPIRAIGYGFVALVMVGMVGALLKLVVLQ